MKSRCAGMSSALTPSSTSCSNIWPEDFFGAWSSITIWLGSDMDSLPLQRERSAALSMRWYVAAAANEQISGRCDCVSCWPIVELRMARHTDLSAHVEDRAGAAIWALAGADVF